MKKLKVLILALVFVFFGFSGASAQTATIDLFQWIFNVNGTVSDSLVPDPFPANFNTAGFNVGTGLGTITATFTNPGSYNFIGFFDHEIDQIPNTFFNEFGAVIGSPIAGQSWEIDDPFGVNIYYDVLAGVLNNSNGVPSAPNDVSMALGWNFNLASGETGIIALDLSQTAPGGGFYLQQTDPDSQASIYYSSTLNIQGGGPAPVPEPGTLLLLGSGLVGLIGLGRRKFKK